MPSILLYPVDTNTLKIAINTAKTESGAFHNNFEIYMKNGSDNASLSWQLVSNASIEVQTYLVRRLEPKKQYTFKMCGRVQPSGYTVCSPPQSTAIPEIG